MSLFDNLFKSSNSTNAYPKKGFDFNYLSDNFSYIRNNKNWNNENVSNCFKILKDCAKLINTTKKPEVFFERYLLALTVLNELIPIEKKLPIKGDTPSKIKKQFYEKEILTVNDFIDRHFNETLDKLNSLKTEKSKTNQINKYCSAFDNYKQYLSNESISKYNSLCIELRAKM